MLTEDKLFSTLDTTVRRLDLPGGRVVLLSDTVGFVRKLPHDLVRAFRSTLEEVAEADLVLHVVDAAATDPAGQLATVRQVLRDIGAADVAELVVWNKADVADGATLRRLREREPGSVAVSAATGSGVDGLLAAVGERLERDGRVLALLVPYARGDVLARLHTHGDVLAEAHEADGTRLEVRVPDAEASRYAEFTVPDP